MTPERWMRLQELFAHLIDLAPDARNQWLGRAELDSDVRAEALALVQAEESLECSLTDTFGSALRHASRNWESIGSNFWPYRILRKIGVGRTGTVFLAEHVSGEFEQLVAIRVVHDIVMSTIDEPVQPVRNGIEDLDHPHIARLLDNGMIAGNQPYFIMEYVDGIAIDEFCAVHQLDMRKRMELMHKVARAIHHAHRKLVVHGALRPKKVLVCQNGEPVVIGFGVARHDFCKADQGGAPAPEWSSPPPYARVEQLRSGGADTTTDVYALGLLLYELISGYVPPMASSASLRWPSMGRISRRAERDLNEIVATATQRDPDRRYASADAFADDVDRYLDDRPIGRMPNSIGSQLDKFVCRCLAGRHRLPSRGP